MHLARVMISDSVTPLHEFGVVAMYGSSSENVHRALCYGLSCDEEAIYHLYCNGPSGAVQSDLQG